MRQSQKSNRPRNKNGRKPSGPSPNRVYESSGPEGKVRGTPQQIIEKYQSLARDKATAGDRVLAEAFLQHAEHYLRVLSASQPVRSEERAQEDRGSDGRQPDDRGGEDRYESGRSDASFADAGSGSGDAGGGNSADGMAVIGDDDDQDGSVIVDTPENANSGRRRGRRPSRRNPRSDDDAEADRSGERRQPARTESADEPGLELGDPAVVSDTTIRAAE